MKPPVLPFHFLRREQSTPVQTLVATFTVRGQPVTSISRTWLPGDAKRCHLCARCTADHRHNFCLVMVNFAVPKWEAPLFSSLDVSMVRNEDRPRFEPIRPGA